MMERGKGDDKASMEKGTMDSGKEGQWRMETGTVQRRRKDGQWTMETGKRDGTASTGICNMGRKFA